MRWGLSCGCVVVSWLVVLAEPSLVSADALLRADEGLGLAESGCVSQLVPGEDTQAASRACQRAGGLIGASAVAATQDGRNVYVASSGADAVVAFSRSGSGALKSIGCVSNNGTNGVDGTKRSCADGDALRGAGGLAVSPDGKNVYAAAW